jgi:hypothetical protein
MLAVAVDLDRDVIILFGCDLIPRLDSSADAKVVGEASDKSACFESFFLCVVLGSVINDHKVCLWDGKSDFFNELPDRVGFIKSRGNYENFRVHRGSIMGYYATEPQ